MPTMASRSVRFPVTSNIQKLKRKADYLLKPRRYVIVHLVNESVGRRFRYRTIDHVEAWSPMLKSEGVLKFPLSQKSRLDTFYMNTETRSGPFHVFSTMSEFFMVLNKV